MFRVSRSRRLAKILILQAVILGAVVFAPAAAQAFEKTTAFAAGWSVNNNADWTPFPPNSNPLGAPDSNCTGASTPTGSWAEFTFNVNIPAADVITGIRVRFDYRSVSTNTAQLYQNGSAIGSTRTIPAQFAGSSNCTNTSWVNTGGRTDLWGTTTLTPADFNNGSISVRLTQNAPTVDLDAVKLVVFHESRHYASGWTVNNNADWTPFPPNTAPLGAPNDVCTGASTPTGSWAQFTFPAFTIPVGHTISGVEVRFKYKTAASNTAQLYLSGSSTGSTRSVAAQSGSFCSSSDWQTAGGAADLWGATLTPADFNSGNVAVRLTQDANTIDLDSVEMIVHH